MNKKTFIVFIFSILLCYIPLNAQKNDILSQLPHPSHNSTLLGIGTSNLYDTYLSPLKYKGTSFRLLHERMKRMGWFDGNFIRQSIFQVEFASTNNPAKNASEYLFMADYNWGAHYNFFRTDKFQFSGGALWNATAGILYNDRNSNNPASARLYTNILLSAVGFYEWKFLSFRWQMDTPIIGVLFSPHYGQSYYEMSLGNTVGVANFASIHNQRALRNYISVDVPINKFCIRVGYLGSFYQTKVHSLKTHNYSNSFMIGLVSRTINLNELRR